MQYQTGDLQPSGILSRWRAFFGTNRSMQLQAPVPLGNDEKYAPSLSHVAPFGLATYQPVRRLDWGSAGFGYDGGRLFYNPIGAGITSTHKPPILPYAVAQVVNRTSIFWSSQMVNGGAQPYVGPLWSPLVLQQLLGPVLSQAVTPPLPGAVVGGVQISPGNPTGM